MSEKSEVKLDFKISWQMLKANYKAFLMTELFTFISFFAVFIVTGSIFAIVVVSIPSLSFSGIFTEIRNKQDIQYSIIGTFVIGLSHALVVGFLNCQYGLAYDIMSSGDMFSEFKRAFNYFRRFWWQYMLLSFISVFSVFFPRRRPIKENLEFLNNIYFEISIVVLQLIIYFIFIIISNGTLPSVTAQGSFKNSFVETFRIIKKYPKRILKTWGIYFLIFIFPIIALLFLRLQLYNFLGPNILYLIFDAIVFLLYLIYLFIGYPLKTLISTRIYNSLEFERFRALTDIEDTNKQTSEDEAN